MGNGSVVELDFTTLGSALEDQLEVDYFTWNEAGQPVLIQRETQEVFLSSANPASFRLESEAAFGSPEFLGLRATFKNSGASLSLAGFALRDNQIGLLSAAGLEFGLGFLLFDEVPLVTNLVFNMGFPEYHWIRCQRVKNMIDPPPPPGATIKWKIVNADGSTWESTGREIYKHASILGGPHHVRAEVVTNGVITEYGSEHYVHRAQQSLDVAVTSTNIVNEIGLPRQVVGPGPQKFTITESYKIKHSAQVKTSVSGTLGSEVTGKVSTATEVTAGVEVEKSTGTGAEIQVPEGKCYQIYDVLTFQVKRGTFAKTFTDGTVVTGNWETKLLTAVSHTHREIECP